MICYRFLPYNYNSHKTSKNMKFKVIVHTAEEGGYWAEIPALPGCITEGDTWEELTNNLQDAIQGWLEVANNVDTLESEDKIIDITV